ncbi:MAG: hypothetical protein JKY98_12445 [Gammaproteobacteria bacterium]|nr:hypothetical protein [Gammaproteobacteria bacterium]
MRTLVAALSLVLFLFGLFPFLPWFAGKKKIYLPFVCAPALVVCAWYFLGYLPSQAVGGMSARQLASALISERSSNGYVEIGFAYPIYTPTISITNNELYTTELDVYLRIVDGNSEAVLFRAVRAILPDARLTVEATVNGLLSENPEYLFIPIAIPPGDTVEGRLVFIISDLNDGSTFDEALSRRYPADFEIREPQSGELVISFPMTRI